VENEPIYRRVVRPRDCAILFGIPTTYDAFRHDLGAANKDLVPNGCPVWPRYRDEVIAPADGLIAAAEARGVLVRRDVRLGDIAAAHDGQRTVVILVSHWTRDRIELADGLHPFHDVVERVPQDFTGFVDLCICISEPMAVSLRALRPRCIIRSALQTYIIPRIWFGAFEALLASLDEHPRPYMDAYNEIIGLFLDGGKDT